MKKKKLSWLWFKAAPTVLFRNCPRDLIPWWRRRLPSFPGDNVNALLCPRLIRRRPILDLDEGTSSLDRSTAEDIEQRLLAMKDLTMLTITLHLSEQSIEQYHDVIQISPS